MTFRRLTYILGLVALLLVAAFGTKVANRPVLAQEAKAAGATALANAQLVLHDNFRAPRIDPSRWTGLDGDFTNLREAVRMVEQIPSDSDDGLLHLFQSAYAFTSSDTGGTGGVFGLGFPNPAAIREVSFTVMVKKNAGYRMHNQLLPIGRISRIAGPLLQHRNFTNEPTGRC